MREQEAEEQGQEQASRTWGGEDQRTPGGSERGGNVRSGQSTLDEKSPWKWLGQPVGPMIIDEGKKQQALEACADLHGALLGCLKKGMFADCSEKQKAFWDCYAAHRGIRGTKIAVWFAPPSSSSTRKATFTDLKDVYSTYSGQAWTWAKDFTSGDFNR